MATLSLRLDAESAALLDAAARRTGQTKSQVMRAAIKEYERSLENNSGESFYDKIRECIGRWKSGEPHLSSTSGEEIARMMLEERQTRDPGRRRTTRRAG